MYSHLTKHPMDLDLALGPVAGGGGWAGATQVLNIPNTGGRAISPDQ